MTTEQLLLEHWRTLPAEKRQAVINFVEFLHSDSNLHPVQSGQALREALGDQLQEIRNQIVDSGIPLLSDEEIDCEVAKRRGGYQETE